MRYTAGTAERKFVFVEDCAEDEGNVEGHSTASNICTGT
jgi:hypothetical protein